MDYTEEVKDLSGDVKLITNEPAFVGPYSIVYHGYLKSSGQLVAVKRMNGIRGTSARTIRRKVQREGWAWSLLLHRNILPFYGYIEDDERFQPYGAFVSPWYRRGDLGQYLQENPSAHLADRLKIWQGVADGVAYLHGYSPVVIHGDLKPGNILVDDGGSAKICDFGLARVIMEEGKSGLTTTTAHTGTSRYLAYELVMAEAGIPTSSSDIYAAGCIGLEAIFREIPYSHRINGNNLLWHIRSDMLEGRFPASPPADSLAPSDSIWKLVLRCWAHDPASRPQAHELSAHLEEILTQMNVVTHLGPIPLYLPSNITQLQAGIHTPEGETFRMEIDAALSSRPSGPHNSHDQNPQTSSFVNRLLGIQAHQNSLPASSQDSAGPYKSFKGSYTHDVHQESPQGSRGPGNTADIITESDVNSGIQGGAAGTGSTSQSQQSQFVEGAPGNVNFSRRADTVDGRQNPDNQRGKRTLSSQAHSGAGHSGSPVYQDQERKAGQRNRMSFPHEKYMGFRARLNHLKQKHKLNLEYQEAVYGPSSAHIWSGRWVLDNNIEIGTGESSTRDGAKEDSAKPALETLVTLGFRE